MSIRPRLSPTNIDPDMGYAAWCQQRITWREPKSLLANLDDELALKRAEPLVLVVVQMARRSTPGVKRILQYEYQQRDRQTEPL